MRTAVDPLLEQRSRLGLIGRRFLRFSRGILTHPAEALDVAGERPQAALDLRGEKDAVVDAKKSIADGVRMLRARSADARIRQLESLLRIASEEEKDRINVAIKRLTDEKRGLGIQSWGSMRGRR